MGASMRKPRCCKIKDNTPPSNGRSSIRSLRGRQVGHRPRFPAILHALFWIFFMIMHYFLLALLVSVIRHPSLLRESSAYMMVLFLDIFSVYFMIFHRREMFGILEDSCATLQDVAPQKLKKINRYFKYFLVAYLLYSAVVMIMQLVSNEYVRGLWDDADGHSSYQTINYLLFSENLQVAPAVEITSMCIYVVLEAFTLFVVGGFLVLLWSYMFSVVVGLGQNLIDYLEELRFSKVEAFNDRFLTVVALIQRLNRLLKNLLVLWFVVTLYSSCFSVTWYIMDNNLTDKVSLNFKLPYMFQEILDLAVLTIAASRIPHYMDKAYRSILFLSKEALVLDKVREYQFMKGQLGSGEFGIKLGGMFLITRKLFLSFLGVGVTYMVVSIQLNPVLFKKLQKDIEKSLEPNATEAA